MHQNAKQKKQDNVTFPYEQYLQDNTECNRTLVIS